MRYCTIEREWLWLLVVRDRKINRHRFSAGLLAAFMLAMQAAMAAGKGLPDAGSEPPALIAEGEADATSYDEQAREMRIWLHQRDQERRSGGVGQLDLSLPGEFVRPEVDTAIPRPLDPFQGTAIDDSGYRAWGDTHVKLRHGYDRSGRSGHHSGRAQTRHGKSVKSDAAASGSTKKNGAKAKEVNASKPHQAPATDSKKGHEKKLGEHGGDHKEKQRAAVQVTNKKTSKTSAAKSRK
jgi:hypothetical protein